MSAEMYIDYLPARLQYRRYAGDSEYMAEKARFVKNLCRGTSITDLTILDPFTFERVPIGSVADVRLRMFAGAIRRRRPYKSICAHLPKRYENHEMREVLSYRHDWTESWNDDNERILNPFTRKMIYKCGDLAMAINKALLVTPRQRRRRPRQDGDSITTMLRTMLNSLRDKKCAKRRPVLIKVSTSAPTPKAGESSLASVSPSIINAICEFMTRSRKAAGYSDVAKRDIYDYISNSNVYVTDDGNCIVCMTDPATDTLLPCRHMSVCKNCSTKCDKCSICRTEPSVIIRMT